MTNITNEQLEAWAGLGPWRTCNVSPSLGHIYGSIGRLATSIGGESNRTQTNAALIAAAPALAAALLAERKAREVEVAKLKAAIKQALKALYHCVEFTGTSDFDPEIAALEQALKGPTP